MTMVSVSVLRRALIGEDVIQPNAQGWYRCQVLHDWQRSAPKNFPPRDSFSTMDPPEVNRIGVFDDRTSHNKVALTATMQFFWAGSMAWHKYGRSLDALTRDERRYINNKFEAVMGPAVALTNRRDIDEETANYVAGTNLDKEPARLAALICGGNSMLCKPAGKNKDGVEMARLYTFLPSDFVNAPVASPVMLTDPRMNWLTAIYAEGEVYPFSTLGMGVGVPYPVITADVYYYPMSGLQLYSFDSPARPLYYRNGQASYR